MLIASIAFDCEKLGDSSYSKSRVRLVHIKTEGKSREKQCALASFDNTECMYYNPITWPYNTR